MLPILNILVYTDNPSLFNETPLASLGGLSDLEQFIRDKTQQFVDVKFRFVSRHGVDDKTGKEIHAENMITNQLLEGIHELWVLGFRRTKNDEEPFNELQPEEIDVLNQFITTGKIGIFVSGDHSKPPAGTICADPDHSKFLSLGRALGKDIPLAGLLRDWDGPPTNCMELPFALRDNFNTIEGPDPLKLDTDGFQYDSVPQTIIPQPSGSQPHRLFTYVDSNHEIRVITKLPDHAHEGRILSDEEIRQTWPKEINNGKPKSLPLPVIAAFGKDKRFNKTEGVVVAFDGDPVSVSRIVVDSSFHHYLNDNLRFLPSRDSVSHLPVPNSDLDQIAHFFGNLALWLAPKSIRTKIKFDVLLALASHTDVLEILELSDARLDRLARDLLHAAIGPARLKWLFGRSPFEETDPVDEFFSFVFLDSEESLRDQSQFPLANALRVSNEYLARHRILDATRITDYTALWQILVLSFDKAPHLKVENLQNTASPADGDRSVSASTNFKGENIMARECKTDWKSFTNVTDPSTDPEKPNDGIISITEMDQIGYFTGFHITPTSKVPLSGKCDQNPHYMRLTTEEGYEYRGFIFPAGDERIAVGIRSRFDREKKRADGDEVWVGVKTT